MQTERQHQHPPRVSGCSRNPSQNTHTHGAHPSHEWRGASGAPTPAHARSGGVQPIPKPKHTHPRRAPSQEWRAASRAPTPAHARIGGVQQKPELKDTQPRRAPKPGVAGCKQSAHTSTHTAQHPSQDLRGAAETRAKTHTPTARTQARSGGVQAEHPHQHTPGVVGCSRNPSPNTHTHGAHQSQELGVKTVAPTPAHARSGGVQPKPEPKNTHPQRAPKPGVAGCKRCAHTSTHTAQHPSQEWRGAAETRAQTHTPTARTQARSGRVQAERPQQHTPGVAGCSRNSSPKTHTHSAHPSQEWRGASGAPTPAHTQPNTPARSGGVQPKPEPKHTHPRRAPKQGVAGCKRSAHTSTRQEWRGAAETQAKTHTPTTRTQARAGGVQAERPHQHTPGVAGCSRNWSPNTHTHGAHQSQEWRGASGAPTPAQDRSGGVQPKPELKHTHPRRVPKPGVAGCKRSAHTSTRQEWWGAAETRAQAHTPTVGTQARSEGLKL